MKTEIKEWMIGGGSGGITSEGFGSGIKEFIIGGDNDIITHEWWIDPTGI